MTSACGVLIISCFLTSAPRITQEWITVQRPAFEAFLILKWLHADIYIRKKQVQNVHWAELGLWLCMCIFHLCSLWSLYNIQHQSKPFDPSELQRLLGCFSWESISVLVDSTFVFLYFLYRKIYSCLVSYAACVWSSASASARIAETHSEAVCSQIRSQRIMNTFVWKLVRIKISKRSL